MDPNGGKKMRSPNREIEVKTNDGTFKAKNKVLTAEGPSPFLAHCQPATYFFSPFSFLGEPDPVPPSRVPHLLHPSSAMVLLRNFIVEQEGCGHT
jgi:hypothetical protein